MGPRPQTMSPACRWGKAKTEPLLTRGQMRAGRGSSPRRFLLPSPTLPLPLYSFSPPPRSPSSSHFPCLFQALQAKSGQKPGGRPVCMGWGGLRSGEPSPRPLCPQTTACHLPPRWGGLGGGCRKVRDRWTVRRVEPAGDVSKGRMWVWTSSCSPSQEWGGQGSGWRVEGGGGLSG